MPRKMILWNNDLRQTVAIKESAKMLRNNELGIEYKALSADASNAQSLNPVFHIADELGEVVGPSSRLFEALQLATAAQRDCLTAGRQRRRSAVDADRRWNRRA